MKHIVSRCHKNPQSVDQSKPKMQRTESPKSGTTANANHKPNHLRRLTQSLTRRMVRKKGNSHGETAPDEGGFQHDWHPGHSLFRKYHANEYFCAGCLERGYGFRYRCEFCHFELHEGCAHAPKFSVHTCHSQHSLHLLSRTDEPRDCDVCDQDIKGALYSCAPCDFDVHLSCMRLPASIFHGTHPEHRLHLYLALPDGDSLPVPSPSAICFICARPFKAGVANYACSVVNCRFYLHVTCAKLPVEPFAFFSVAMAPADLPAMPLAADSGVDSATEEEASAPPTPLSGSTSASSRMTREFYEGDNRSTSIQSKRFVRRPGFHERIRCLHDFFDA